uniref:Uncharacterized protein n=1 Tax=Rhizophora mucronata TaxID=61149 RepID=A0A2P2N8B8_RHIMU
MLTIANFGHIMRERERGS